MSEVRERFCREYWSYNDISEDRRTDQAKVLREFEDRLDGDLLAASANDLRDYLASCSERGLHPNTVRRIRGEVLPFFSWAQERGLISRLALLEIRDVRAPRGAVQRNVPNPYSRKEIAEFWAELDQRWPRADDKWVQRWMQGRSPWSRVRTHGMNLQVRAIAALALYCGLRRSEIHRANLDDIHADNEYAVVRYPARKGRDHRERPPREVPITVGGSRLLAPWLEFREAMDPPHDRPWLSLHGQNALNPMSIYRFSELLLRIGRGWQLQRFRHTCGTEWLRAGMPLEHVKDLLGHASIQETLGYAKIVPEDVRKSAFRNMHIFDRAIGPPEEDHATERPA